MPSCLYKVLYIPVKTKKAGVFDSPASRDHLAGMLLAGFSDHCTAQHSRYFFDSRAVVEQAHLDFGAAVIFALFDEEVLVGEGRDLG